VVDQQPAPGKKSLATETFSESHMIPNMQPDDDHGPPPDPLMTTSDRPRTRFLKANCQLKLGFWNVRTMAQPSKTEQVLEEMESYGLDILALSEVRWTGAGNQNLKKGFKILQGGTDKKKEADVAIMLSK
jgi:hypothetical protein